MVVFQEGAKSGRSRVGWPLHGVLMQGGGHVVEERQAVVDALHGSLLLIGQDDILEATVVVVVVAGGRAVITIGVVGSSMIEDEKCRILDLGDPGTGRSSFRVFAGPCASLGLDHGVVVDCWKQETDGGM